MEYLKKVSVIIPCYNVEAHIGYCLESVYNQTYPNLEIIAVDNNSRDNTLKLLETFKQSNLMILKESKQGAPAARNKALNQSKGEWIQFLDADDILLPRKIEIQVEKALSCMDSPDLIVGNFIRRHSNGKETGIFSNQSDPWEGLLKTRLGNTCSNLWKREFLLKIGGWDEDLKSSQEAELMFRILRNKGRIIFDDNFNTIIHSRPGSISSTNRLENWLRYIDLRKKIISHLVETGLYTKERASAADEILFVAIQNIYSEDPQKAITLFRKLLPNNYIPKRYSKVYKFFYKALGFRFTECIRNRFKI